MVFEIKVYFWYTIYHLATSNFAVKIPSLDLLRRINLLFSLMLFGGAARDYRRAA